MSKIKIKFHYTMSEYNEKQLRIAKEYREAQAQNIANYNARRKEHLEEMEAEERAFVNTKTQLAIELQNVLSKRAELRRQGLTNFSVEIQNNMAEENAIHEKQRNNRESYFEKKGAHKKQIAILHEACCGTGSFLRASMQEQCLKLEKEEAERKAAMENEKE